MIDLSKTFLQCQHCKHHFSEPRHVCPACDWPRSHSDETPPPTWSQPDPNAQPAQPAPQVAQGIIPLEVPVQLEMPLAASDAPAPVPQAAPGILADIPVPTVKPRRGTMRAAQTLTLPPEGETT